MRCLSTGKGMLTYSPSIVATSAKVLKESATSDLHVAPAPGNFKNGQIGTLEETPELSVGAWQMRLLSRGYIGAKSTRPVKRAALPVTVTSSASVVDAPGCALRPQCFALFRSRP